MAYASLVTSRVSEFLKASVSVCGGTLLPELAQRLGQRGLAFGLGARLRAGLADLRGELGDALARGLGLPGECAGPFDGALDPLLGHHLPFLDALRTGTPRARSSALSRAEPCLMPAFLSAAMSAASVHFLAFATATCSGCR